MNKKIGNLFKGDKVIWMVFFFLCMISIVEVFSASSHLTYKTHSYLSPIMGHASKLAIGVLVAIITLNIPCRFFKLVTPFLLLVTALMLIWVLAFGTKTNDAGRWIALFGVKFQPSEIAKGTLVLATAQILSAMQREDGADRNAMKYILCVLVPFAALIGVENLSTAVLIFAVVLAMMFIGRVPLPQLGKLVGVLMAGAVVGILLIFSVGSLDKNGEEQPDGVAVQQARAKEEKSAFDVVTHRFGTWRNRLVNHSGSTDVSPEEYDLNKNYQVGHANIAIATSGIIGKGPGNSVERDFLPQAFSDFIFAIIIEEMGVVGAFAVVFLYVILLFRAARIAGRCENNFPAFLVLGLSLLLVFQATINMLVAVGLMPVTGQPLPLISRGGTSTIINCAYIGAILSVSRSAKRKPELASDI